MAVYTTGRDEAGNWYIYNTGVVPFRKGMLFYGNDTAAFDRLKAQLNSVPGTEESWEGDFSNSQYGGGYTGGGSTGTSKNADDAEAKRIAEEEAQKTSLKGEIAGYADDVESVYAGLFGDLNNLVTSRDQELEAQYGDQLKKAGEQYAGAIPEIETSYASIGAGESTDTMYSKNKAKKGFDDTTETIGKNKESDKAKLGQYKQEQEAKFTADRQSARNNINQASSTTDLNALRGLRNDLNSNITQTGVTKATLGTDGAARKAVTDLTKDGGRFEAAINSLDSIINSSLSGSVKQAAVKAIVDSAGLSEEEKKKVDAQYGNVYAEQQAL